jgi:hypothetical protein
MAKLRQRSALAPSKEPLFAATHSHRVRLEDITHRFSDFTAVSDIDLDVASGELAPCWPIRLRQVHLAFGFAWAHRGRYYSTSSENGDSALQANGCPEKSRLAINGNCNGLSPNISLIT